MTDTNKPGGIVMLSPHEKHINPPIQAGLSLPHIAARFFDTPLLIQPDKVQALAWALRGKLGLNVDQPEGAIMEASGPGLAGERMDSRTGYYVDRGVAVIPIRGTLVNRGAWVGSYSGLTSYEGISNQLDMVARDDRVEAVMFDIHSYGGEATGVDDLGRMIRSLGKPTYAMIDGAGSSGAYWIAAACDRVYIAQSSHGGSIGVVITHASYQQALENAGVVVTHIHAGADKVLGSPYRDLSDTDREKLQAKVDKTYRAFVEAIAGFRGLTTEEVRATEANVYDGDELVGKGLADGVTTGRRLLAAIQEDFSNPAPEKVADFSSGNRRANGLQGEPSMSDQNRNGGAEKTAEATYTKAEVDELLAEQRQELTANFEQQTEQLEDAAKDRVLAIVGCDEAVGREDLARSFAADRKISAEQAVNYLKAAPAASPAASDPLAAAMAGKTPGISSDDADADDPSGASEEEQAANFILNA